MLALILALVPTHDFTVYVGGGYTNSSSTLTLPTPPPGATHVHLDIDHEFAFGLGVETDEFGPIDATYVVDADLNGHWKLTWLGNDLCGRRAAWSAGFAGGCEPFDGVYDWAGTSGQSTAATVPTNASVTISVNMLSLGPLVLGSRASSYVEADLAFGVPWGVGEVGASVTYLTSSQWSAVVRGTWLP